MQRIILPSRFSLYSDGKNEWKSETSYHFRYTYSLRHFRLDCLAPFSLMQVRTFYFVNETELYVYRACVQFLPPTGFVLAKFEFDTHVRIQVSSDAITGIVLLVDATVTSVYANRYKTVFTFYSNSCKYLDKCQVCKSNSFLSTNGTGVGKKKVTDCFKAKRSFSCDDRY